MMNALRMVWIISRHYSDDARMGSLFARIANEIGNRVEMAVDQTSLFRMQAADTIKLITVAKSVLDGWYSVYMHVRETIEANGRDARWEFSRPMLFDRTSYMSEICTDLTEMVEILDDFYKFLGPELKAVTGDTEGIDAVIARVQDMVKPIETLQFPIFDREHADDWAQVKAKFYEDNEKIKVFQRVSFNGTRISVCQHLLFLVDCWCVDDCFGSVAWWLRGGTGGHSTADRHQLQETAQRGGRVRAVSQLQEDSEQGRDSAADDEQVCGYIGAV
jgi:hypothetical protein